MISSNVRPALVMIVLMTILLGALYPAAVTAIAAVIFPSQASGSLIEKDGKIIGSALIGQPFSDPGHFWSRPSATGPFPYNAARFERIEPGAAEPGADRCGHRAHQSAARCRSRQHRAGAGRSGHRVGQRARSAHQPGRGGVSGGAHCARAQPRSGTGSGRW